MSNPSKPTTIATISKGTRSNWMPEPLVSFFHCKIHNAPSPTSKVAPALLEQIQPFTWLNSKEIYLVLLAGGTHFSAVGQSQETDPLPLPAALIGLEPKLARRYLQALSVAFFETYVASSKQYRSYLSANYAQTISQPLLELNLVQSQPTNLSTKITKPAVLHEFSTIEAYLEY